MSRAIPSSPTTRSAAIIWNDAGQKHELRNLRGGLYQNILVELKNGK